MIDKLIMVLIFLSGGVWTIFAVWVGMKFMAQKRDMDLIDEISKPQPEDARVPGSHDQALREHQERMGLVEEEITPEMAKEAVGLDEDPTFNL